MKATNKLVKSQATPRSRGVAVDSFLLGLSTLITVSGSSAFSYNSQQRHRSINLALGSDFAQIGNDMKRAISKELEIEKASS